MKKFFFIAVLLIVAAVAFTSCTTSGYATRPYSSRYYRGAPAHVDNYGGYNAGHGSMYGGNSHGRVARGHHGW